MRGSLLRMCLGSPTSYLRSSPSLRSMPSITARATSWTSAVRSAAAVPSLWGIPLSRSYSTDTVIEDSDGSDEGKLNDLTLLSTTRDPSLGLDVRELNNGEYRDFGLHIKVREMAKLYGIWDHVVDSFRPEINLVVEYPDERLVHRGNFMTPAQTKCKPSIKFLPEGAAKKYTVLMTTPDYPAVESDEKKERLHWLLSNVGAKADSSSEILPYLGPVPAQNGGFHRYVLLLLEQPENVKFDDVNEDARSTFSTRDFIAKHDLKPCGLAFFHAAWDQGVAESCAQAGIEELVHIPIKAHRRRDVKFPSSQYIVPQV